MLWDIFCRVIDNYGDIGVSWRLCADMAARGEQVRLWVDDASALQWMAPGAAEGLWPGVHVLDWAPSGDKAVLATLPTADVWIETFGCEIAPAFIAHFAHATAERGTRQPVWINLEYLSAEPYVERSHGLLSPVMQGPAKGWHKFFFYPGFTELTGSLLREPGLMQEMALHADAKLRADFFTRIGVRPEAATQDERLVSLFCYEPPLLQALLDQLAVCDTPVHLLVTAGRATHAVQALWGQQTLRGSLRIDYLPALTQKEFDQLLWHCDINFVRGEDSVVRALWAGKPFVWHIYPQDDLAHAAKLEAFMQQMQWGQSVCHLHRAWNGLLPTGRQDPALLPLSKEALGQWQQEVQAARARLLKLDDLCSQLVQFALKNR
ncbi:elongation factor P maturation arginine rhamnosyltransferase EarP [Rhodoferax lacus]|uniref:Protein-arginine rhamnosyltransferase n=1 Tax=Rhodoferax lacus TaxID=2184758 RepID=A0A3E1RHK1_9BURK|nr:elongation factor P maturation arginine rhamnosyltransferase EarP [Rhodoferax lacus]RFO98838.1 elongation factor P maturation arginine rhamnosyltransferase EarP [Rhodoferax lacus]